MAHLRGLAGLGVVNNPPYLGEWPQKIGLYMLNFGGIELISYHFLNALEPTRALFERNLNKLLGSRIDRILHLVRESTIFSAEQKVEIENAWIEARELSHWRNRIAHNPVLPTWKPGSDAERSAPDLIGIPDMRQAQGSNVSDSIGIDGLNKLIDASYAVAQRLHASASPLRTSEEGGV